MKNVENYEEHFSQAGLRGSHAQRPQLVRGRARDYAVCTDSPCPLPTLGSAGPRAHPPCSLLRGSVPEPSQGHRSPEEIHPPGEISHLPELRRASRGTRGRGLERLSCGVRRSPAPAGCTRGAASRCYFPTCAVMRRQRLGLVKPINS